MRRGSATRTAAGGDEEKDRAGPAGHAALRNASPLHTAFVTFAAVVLAAVGEPPAAPSPPLPARTAAAPTAATTPPITVGSRLETSKLAACRGAARGRDTLCCPTSASAAVGRKTTLIICKLPRLCLVDFPTGSDWSGSGCAPRRSRSHRTHPSG